LIKEIIMHDIDRTQTEYARGSEEFDAGEFDSGEFEFDAGEFDTGEFDSGEYESDQYGEAEGLLDEIEEMELAAELLSISSEEELDQFLGKVFKKVWGGIRKVGSAVGKIARPLSGVLKGIAKKALPFVGGALGSFIPIPGVGTAVGSALGSAVSKALETELEGVNPEEREFEMARHFVRLAAGAAQEAASVKSDNPAAAAQKAVITAARQQLPNLGSGAPPEARPTGPSRGGARSARSANDGSRRAGRWIRRGRKIVLLGV
jgi:hypothetical protein